MASFRVVDHTVPCQHIREYPRAMSGSQEDVLYLAVKQYIPLDNPTPQPGDVTLIGAHANGFPKELYEPLWDEMHACARRDGWRIRSIWIADVAQQGHSGVVNEPALGNDPCWNDHPRDLLHLINMKRDLMPRPLVGIGHSMGGNNVTTLSYIHPRLFTSLILIDPVIAALSATANLTGPSPAHLSTYRRDVWPSREAAAKSFKTQKFYKTWDPRVLDRWIKYGLRDLPTPTHPDTPQATSNPPVTLTTPISQEVHTFLRPNYEGYGSDGKPVNRKTHADLNPTIPNVYPFYRPEPPHAFFQLVELRPSVLYIFGGKSDVTTPELVKAKLDTTGIGIGGSGGVAAGRVKSVTFDDIGHLIAMEAVERTADHSSAWIGAEIKRWRDEEDEHNRAWHAKTLLQKQMIDEQWKKMIGPPLRKKAQPKL